MTEYDHSGREPENWREDVDDETVDLLDALATAVEGKVCAVSACQTNPIAERNGRALCAKHREMFDHSTHGRPCQRCGSREWVRTPDAKTEAWCAHCEYATYDKEVFAGSW